MDDYTDIINSLNKPLILSRPISNLHKIFTKYTSHPYYKYSFELLETLCNQTNYDNKKRLLHMAFTYLTLILYNCGNIPYISNLDLMILCCFNLSIKTIKNQKNVPCLNKLIKIYKEKFSNYRKEDIVKVELICIKLLNYKINILTSYECLYYLIYSEQYDEKKFKDFLGLATKELEKKIINNINENISKKPLDFAKEIINNINERRNKVKYPKILKRKIVPISQKMSIDKKTIEKNNNEKYIEDYYNNNINQDYNYMKNLSNYKYSPINSPHNKNLCLKSHINKIKPNIYSKPISLVLPYSEYNYSSYKKNKLKKVIDKNLFLSSSNLINSFTNMDIELNNSPINKTNCESSSPNGSDGIPSFILNNNSGIKLAKNSSYGNVIKKPCFNSKNAKTFLIIEKKKNSKNKSVINFSQDNIFYDEGNNELIVENKKKRDFSRTFYFEKFKKESKSKNRQIIVY